jgi:hypothetical protein
MSFSDNDDDEMFMEAEAEVSHLSMNFDKNLSALAREKAQRERANIAWKKSRSAPFHYIRNQIFTLCVYLSFCAPALLI